MATRKGQSIGNMVMRNSGIGKVPMDIKDQHTQECGGWGCKCCSHMSTCGDRLTINGDKLQIPRKYNCKTNNCIYLARCKLCSSLNSENIFVEDTYFGQTSQKFHKRVNGHRACFTAEDYKKSALSLHAMEHHPDHFKLDIYQLAVIKEVAPRNLNREEFRLIEKFKTNCIGLNRCKVER